MKMSTLVGVFVILMLGFSWASAQESTPEPTTVERISFQQAFGGRARFWEVYFTAPTGSRDRSRYAGGVDTAVAADIDQVQSTLDIVAFEMNNEAITEAIIRAHQRGVVVRIVTDDEHGIGNDDTTLVDLEALGIPIVNDNRSGLMHNKFMIMDSRILWMGSMNYTINGSYRNNNNALRLESPQAIVAYQAEFDEMFIEGRFGITSPTGNSATFEQDGISMSVYFASEDDVMDAIIAEINNAETDVRFLAFSFTYDALGEALVARSQDGVNVQGVFERVGSGTVYSEVGRLVCNNIDARTDGNPFVHHHKVFIIDGETVVTGSFNFSSNAVSQNDENLMIIHDPVLASLYLEEFDRMYANSREANFVDCATNHDSPTQDPIAHREQFLNAYVAELRTDADTLDARIGEALETLVLDCQTIMSMPSAYALPDMLSSDETFRTAVASFNSAQASMRVIYNALQTACDTKQEIDTQTYASYLERIATAITNLDAIPAMVNGE